MNEPNQKGWSDQKPAGLPGPGQAGQGGSPPPTPPPAGGMPPHPSSSSPPKPNPPAQAGHPAPPPPPPPEISLRTMKSDLDSLKQTGGTTPVPKPFTPPELKKDLSKPTPSTPPAPMRPPQPAPSKITPSSFESPKPGSTPLPPLSSTKEEKSETPIIEEEAPGTSKLSKLNLKKILIWSGVVLIAIAVGLVGYFYIFPALFPSQSAPEPILTTPPPAAQEPAPPATQEPTTPAIPEVRLHESLLSSTDTVIPMQLLSLDLTSITDSLGQEAQNMLPSGSLAEIILTDASGQVLLSEYLSKLLPGLSPEILKGLFKEDFTTAFYYDGNGVWPIYILKLNLEANIVEAQNSMSGLEQFSDLSNLFLVDPGTANSAGFKAGKANDLTTRYLSFSSAGAALNTAWDNDTLVVSTSYNGLKKALENLK